MKRILPINLKNNFYTECWTFFRFAIIDAYDQLEHWKYYSNNYLYTDDMGNLFWGKYGEIYSPMYSYNDILKISGYLHSEIDKGAIKDFIKNRIDEGEYILLECNYFHFSPYIQYDYVHELLIYGYNDEENVFYSPLLLNGEWTENTISYSKLEDSYASLDKYNEKTENLLDYKRVYLMPVTVMKPLFNNYEDKNDFYQFYFYFKNLKEESVTIKNKRYYYNGYFSYYKALIRAGENIINGENIYYENEYNYTVNIKKLSSFRFILYNYVSLINLNYLKNELNDLNLFIKDKVLKLLNICSGLSLKYSYNKKKECIEKLISHLNEIIIIETDFFNGLEKCIEKYAKNNY